MIDVICENKKEVKYIADKPFKNRQEIKARIKLCGNWATVCVFLAFIFVIIAIIQDALNITLGLETMSWFLMGIFFVVVSLSPNIHLAVYRHLYGIESENKNK